VTPAQAEIYFDEIQRRTFLQNYIKIMISVDGMYKHNNNVNFMRNVSKVFPQSSPDDPFFYRRCLVYKLQFKNSKIKKKEIVLSQDETKFIWYYPGELLRLTL